MSSVISHIRLLLGGRIDNVVMEVINYLDSLEKEAYNLNVFGRTSAQKKFVADIIEKPKIPLAIPIDSQYILNDYLNEKATFEDVHQTIFDLRGLYTKIHSVYSSAGIGAVFKMEEEEKQKETVK